MYGAENFSLLRWDMMSGLSYCLSRFSLSNWTLSVVCSASIWFLELAIFTGHTYIQANLLLLVLAFIRLIEC